VQSGETLSWIAGLYEVPLADLMAWNGLNNSSVIIPGQNLLLRVTPPATATLTETPSPTAAPVTASPSMTPAPPTETQPATDTDPSRGPVPGLALGLIAVGLLGGLLWWRFLRKKVGE
jgi:hypothetical protein